MLAALALACACQGRGDVPPPAEPAGAPLDRAGVLGDFLTAYWKLPVPVQGELPAGFAEAEGSLDPAVCGACHPRQHREWQTSLHAGAFSPGFAGQLIEGGLASPANVRHCQTCHTPLGEQQPWTAAHAEEPRFDPALRAQGLVCAGCHVRAHRRYGPPRRGALPAVEGPLPHGGFEERPEFQQSRFCAACHQFFGRAGVNGKPIENTWAEWKASPQAAAGRTCQSCHMPDRAHDWRGIHDADTVRAAVDVDLVAAGAAGDRIEASLLVTNRDVGHAFPTYVTPRVFLAVWQVDGHGAEIEGTRREHRIGREIDFRSSPRREVFDTRVRPGRAERLDYALARAPGATALVGRVTVDPDFHYRGVFERLLSSLESPEARRLITEALRRTEESSYVLAELRHALD